MSNICWYNKKSLPEIQQAAERDIQKNFNIQHFQILKELLNECKGKTLVSIGCGNANVSRFTDFDYTGVDLSHIIENVAEKFNPNNKYIEKEINLNSDISFIKDYDVVLLNAFIDILENPISILYNILSNSKDQVIIHRQEITSGKTDIVLRGSYGAETFHSKINYNDFYSLIQESGFKVLKVKELGFKNWEGGGNSFLLKKYV